MLSAHYRCLQITHIATDALIDKVPNKTSLEPFILSNDVPILLEPATRVAHSVTVLALNERFLVLGSIGIDILLTVLLREIHRAEQLGIIAFPRWLPVYRATSVLTLYPAEHSCEVRTIGCLVAHRPNDD